MCHVMPKWHLQEWQEMEEQVFVHSRNSGAMLLHLSESVISKELSKCRSSLQSDMLLILASTDQCNRPVFVAYNCHGVPSPAPPLLATILGIKWHTRLPSSWHNHSYVFMVGYGLQARVRFPNLLVIIRSRSRIIDLSKRNAYKICVIIAGECMHFEFERCNTVAVL